MPGDSNRLRHRAASGLDKDALFPRTPESSKKSRLCDTSDTHNGISSGTGLLGEGPGILNGSSAIRRQRAGHSPEGIEAGSCDRLGRRGRFERRLGHIGGFNIQASDLLFEHLASREHRDHHGGLGVPVQQQSGILVSGTEELGSRINLLSVLTEDYNDSRVP